MNTTIPSGRAVAPSRLRLHPVHRILAAGLSAVLAVLLQLVPAAHADPPVVTLTRLHSFGDPLTDAASSPHSRLIEGSDGALYGTTYQGGATGYGTVFRVNKDGTGFAVLKSFNLGTDGVNPVGGVTEGSDGALYGTAYQGGASGYGTVFRVSKDGTGFAVLKSLNGGTDGRYLESSLTEGSDGALYGTASQGGASGYGTVFRVDKDGTGFGVLKSLNGGTDGRYFHNGVTEGSDGALFGTAIEGGLFDYGTVFRVNKDGTGFAVLKSFDLVTRNLSRLENRFKGWNQLRSPVAANTEGLRPACRTFDCVPRRSG